MTFSNCFSKLDYKDRKKALAELLTDSEKLSKLVKNGEIIIGEYE